DQRALRDKIRTLMSQVAASGSSAEPVEFQAQFDSLAVEQRTHLTEVGTISDLAGDELGLLESKSQDDEQQLSEEEQVRMVQLQSLEYYLEQARSSLADTRRLLRRLQGERGHQRADSGLRQLKRARDQLLDPVTLLKGIAQDQNLALMHTTVLDQLAQPEALQLDPQAEKPAEDPRIAAARAVRAWLTPEHLRERQADMEQRTSEILLRFTSVAESRQSSGDGSDGAPEAGGDPAASVDEQRQQRTLDAAVEAIPFLQEAVAAMQASSSALTGEQLAQASAAQQRALTALAGAIERFSGIRALIELTHAEHNETIALLTPPDTADGSDGATGAGAAGDNDDSASAAEARPDLAGLSTAERVSR
ncbi:MAG: hypothetical protein AAGC55_33270, partial [Myxococcota bacterium]